MQVDSAEDRLHSAYMRYWEHLPHLSAHSQTMVVTWLVWTAMKANEPETPARVPAC